MSNRIPSLHPKRDLLLKTGLGLLSVVIGWQFVMNKLNPMATAIPPIKNLTTRIECKASPYQNCTIQELSKILSDNGYRIISSTQKTTLAPANFLQLGNMGLDENVLNTTIMQTSSAEIKTSQRILDLKIPLIIGGDSLVVTATATENCTIAVYNPETQNIDIIKLAKNGSFRIADFTIGGYNWKNIGNGVPQIFVVEEKNSKRSSRE